MSTPEVTITLGRTGQVVKRKWRDSNGGRSESLQFPSTRQRGNDGRRIPSRDGYKDAPLDHKDLRLTLIHKRMLDSNSNRTPIANGKSRSVFHKNVSARGAQSSGDSDDMNWHDIESRRNRQALHFSSQEDPKYSFCLDSTKNYHSSLERDDLTHSRARSPRRILRTSRSVSPPAYWKETWESVPMRPNGTSAAQHSFRNVEPSRPLLLSHMMTHPNIVTARPVLPPPPPSGTTQRTIYMGEAPINVSGLLGSLGLAKYAIHFQAEEVDMTALKQMGEKDLKAIGIPMGPRKKILQALAAISRRPLPPPMPPSNRQL